MMKLVDDDDVEVTRFDRATPVRVAGSGSTRRRGRTCGPIAADPSLAERCIPQGVPKGRSALIEDLVAMCNEEQPISSNVVRSRA